MEAAIASIHRVAEKLKASYDEGAEVQKEEEHYHYHDSQEYEVVSTHDRRLFLRFGTRLPRSYPRIRWTGLSAYKLRG